MSIVHDALLELGDDVATVRLAPASAVRARGDWRRHRQRAGTMVLATTVVTGAVVVTAPFWRGPAHLAPGVAAPPEPTCYTAIRYVAPSVQQGSLVLFLTWATAPDPTVIEQVRAIAGVRSVTAAAGPEGVNTSYRIHCDPLASGSGSAPPPGAGFVVEVASGQVDSVGQAVRALSATHRLGEVEVMRLEMDTPPWCGVTEIDGFTTMVRLRPGVTAAQRAAVETTLRALPEVDSVDFSSAAQEADENAVCERPTLGPTAGHFVVRMKTDYQFDQVRDAVVALPGVDSLVPPGSRVN